MSYGIALGATLCALLVGLYPIRVNQRTHSMSFSAIMRTTRNPTLNALVVDADDKGRQNARVSQKVLGKAQLQFGLPRTGAPATSADSTEGEPKLRQRRTGLE